MKNCNLLLYGCQKLFYCQRKITKRKEKIVRISSDFLHVYFCSSLIPLKDNNILFYFNINSLFNNRCILYVPFRKKISHAFESLIGI